MNQSIIIILLLAVCTFLYLAIDGYVNLPTVHKSISTKECVKVISNDGFKHVNGCSSLPPKYHVVWVQ